MKRSRRVRSFSDSDSAEPPDLSDSEDSPSQAVSSNFLTVYCVYLMVSIATNLVGKQLLTNFPFPTTATMVQLSSTFIYSLPACYILNIPSVDYKDLKYTVFIPIIFLTCGKFTFQFATQQSIKSNTISFTHTVKASMPIFTVFFERLISRHHSLPVYLSLLPIVLGVSIASLSEIAFNWVGFTWAIIATAVFSIQNIGSKMFMEVTRMHTLRLLSILAGLSTLFFFYAWVYSDGLYFYSTNDQLSKMSRPVTGLLLFLDGFCNFMQNLLAFKMISMVQPLTYSVFNAFKRVAVILVSVAIFKNPVSAINFFGMGLAIFGVWTYSKAKIREQRLKRKRPLLPTVQSMTDIDNSMDGVAMPKSNGLLSFNGDLPSEPFQTKAPILTQHLTQSSQSVSSSSAPFQLVVM